jgi:hypothetical protein
MVNGALDSIRRFNVGPTGGAPAAGQAFSL